MYRKMKGQEELEQYVKKSRRDSHAEHVEAVVREKRTAARLSPQQIGKIQAENYARAMYLSGLSGERCL